MSYTSLTTIDGRLRFRRSRNESARPPLPVIIPLLTAAMLAALRPLMRKRSADSIAIAAATANMVICVRLVLISSNDTIVYWFGNWRPRGGIALGRSEEQTSELQSPYVTSY